MMQTILSDKISQDLQAIDFAARLTFPEHFAELLSKTVLLGGKRLRPLLVLLMGEHLSCHSEKLVHYAKLVEWIHAASLSHDDVVDQATTRRGAPSINAVGGNKRAVLAGDYLLGQVIRELVNQDNHSVLDHAAVTIQNLAQGEWLQLQMIENKSFTLEHLNQVAQWKTASLMALCCAIPCELAAPHLVEMAWSFGHHLGLAFQQIDDCLDFSKTSLKDQWLDLKNGQLNFVLYFLTQDKPQIYQAFLEGHFATDIVRESDIQSALKKVRLMAEDHILQAKNILIQLPGARTDALLNLCQMIQNREK